MKLQKPADIYVPEPSTFEPIGDGLFIHHYKNTATVVARCECGRCNKIEHENQVGVSESVLHEIGWRKDDHEWLCPFCTGDTYVVMPDDDEEIPDEPYFGHCEVYCFDSPDDQSPFFAIVTDDSFSPTEFVVSYNCEMPDGRIGSKKLIWPKEFTQRAY